MKLVVWDLDDTIWQGTYIYDGEKVIPSEVILKTIKEFDRLGVLQSIISRNSPDVYNYVEKLGLGRYFILPKVNWNNKAQNMEQLLNEVHILPKDVFFVDDSPREREEMHMNFPEIECVRPIDISAYVKDATPSGSNEERKRFFNDEAKRLALKGDDFVKMLDLELVVKQPSNDNEYERILELVNRSNQLNATGNRYNTYQDLVNGRNIAIGYPKDKYGDYGLSLIAVYINEGYDDNDMIIKELVISCRVMDRKLIGPFLWALRQITSLRKINMEFVMTKYNRPLFEQLMEFSPHITKTYDTEDAFLLSFDNPEKPESVRVTIV